MNLSSHSQAPSTARHPGVRPLPMQTSFAWPTRFTRRRGGRSESCSECSMASGKPSPGAAARLCTRSLTSFASEAVVAARCQVQSQAPHHRRRSRAIAHAFRGVGHPFQELGLLACQICQSRDGISGTCCPCEILSLRILESRKPSSCSERIQARRLLVRDRPVDFCRWRIHLEELQGAQNASIADDEDQPALPETADELLTPDALRKILSARLSICVSLVGALALQYMDMSYVRPRPMAAAPVAGSQRLQRSAYHLRSTVACATLCQRGSRGRPQPGPYSPGRHSGCAGLAAIRGHLRRVGEHRCCLVCIGGLIMLPGLVSRPLRLFDVETNCTLGRAVPPQTTPWIAVLRLGRKHGCPSLATALRRVEADVGETICGTVVLEADAGALPELLPGDAPASFVPVLRRPAASAGLAAALEEAEAEGLAAIRGELRWGQPLLVESLPSKSLPIEFWLNPASAAGRKQLRAAAVALRPLRQHLTWQIHWPVTWRANSSEKATEFCISGSDLTSFDAAGFVCMASGKASDSAAALLEEAAHLRCVEDGDFEKAMRWEYLERTFAACEDGDGTASCSARQLQALGDKRCVPNNFTAFVLSEARKPRPWPMGLRGDSPDFAVRIAGWAFGGMPEAEAIFEAVCAVLRLPGPTKPSACGEVWHWRAPGWFLRRVPLWPHSCLSLLLSFLLPFCWPAFRRTLGRLCSCCPARRRS
eukprot:s1725_g9.t3